MSIEKTDAADFFTLESKTGDVLLTVSDYLDWWENESRYLNLLQEKLNAYLRFVESGEITTRFPVSVGRRVVINVTGMFPLSDTATAFFVKARTMLIASEIELRFTLHPSD